MTHGLVYCMLLDIRNYSLRIAENTIRRKDSATIIDYIRN